MLAVSFMSLRYVFLYDRPPAVLFVIAIVLPIVAAIGLAIGQWYAAVALATLIYVFILYEALADPQRPGRRDVFFWSMFGLVFIACNIHKTTGYSTYFLLEVVLLLLLPLLVGTLFTLLKESNFFRLWFLGVGCFILWSIACSVFGRSHLLAAVFQFATNLKLFISLLLGFYLCWSTRTEKVFWFIVRWLWLPLMLLIAWQWGHPSSYFGLLGHADPGTRDPLGLFPSRGLGLFQHPTYLGTYAGIFLFLCVLKAISGDGRRNWWFAFCYFLVLTASTQREEIVVAVAISVAVMSLWKGKRFAVRSIFLASGLAVAFGAASWLLIKDNLINTAINYGVVGSAHIQEPRAVLYTHSFQIAEQYFPGGSGLGTFGSSGAEKFDRSLYLDHGFAAYWWFDKENFLMDTYWPNFIAEEGFIGAFLMLVLLASLPLYAALQSLKVYPAEIRLYWLMAFGSLSFSFLLSLLSPSYQDPALFLIPSVLVGVAYNRARYWEKS